MPISSCVRSAVDDPAISSSILIRSLVRSCLTYDIVISYARWSATARRPRLASQRTRRADLEQEILFVERQLSAAERRIAPDAVGRLGEVILAKVGSKDATARQFISKVVVAPDLITISGPITPLEIAAS